MKLEPLPLVLAVAAALAVKALVLFRGAERTEKLFLALVGIAVFEVVATAVAFVFVWLISLPGEWLGLLGIEAGLALPPNLVVADGATRGAEGARKAGSLLLAILAYPVLAGIAIAIL